MRQRGSASVWLLALILPVCALWLVLGLREQAVLARHRVEATADRAALAAAAATCESATAVAARAAAHLQACTSAAGTVTVLVELPVRLAVLGTWTVRARAAARAGPAVGIPQPQVPPAMATPAPSGRSVTP